MNYFGKLFGGIEDEEPAKKPAAANDRRNRQLTTTPPGLVDGDALEAAQQLAGKPVITLDELLNDTDVPLPSGEPRTLDIDYEDVT